MAGFQTDLLTPRSGAVKAARKLARRAFRAEKQLFLAEGAKAVAEALEVPDLVVEVFATLGSGLEHDALRERAVRRGVPWRVATDEAVASLCGAVSPQGMVAVCRYLDLPWRQALDVAGTGPIVVCADVRDPGNAGTIIRTADAVDARAVILAGNSVDPYNDKTVRATVGSLFHVPIALAPDPAEVVAVAQQRGETVLAADGRGERHVFEGADLLTEQVTWLFGNEAWGLPEELAAAASHRVAIPIRGQAESLNLATAAAVCLYETLRVRSFQAGPGDAPETHPGRSSGA